MTKVLRKCKKCSERFDILSNDYLKVKGGFYHLDCYINVCLKKGLSKESIDSSIDIIRESMKLEQELKDKKEIEKNKNRLESKKKEVNRQKDKDDFYNYIYERYNMTNLPKVFYSKVASINTGNYYNLKKAIPYSDLLDMFKRQEGYLNRIRMKNESLNKDIKGINLLNYELAVIVGMYDSYLEWKHKQKMLEVEVKKKEEIKNIVKIDMSKVEKQSAASDEDDILDILDDIY